MKSERRHELQKNELADWLGTSIESIRPHLKLIVMSIVGVVAIIAVVAVLMRQQSAGVAEGWRQFMQVSAGQDPEALLSFSDSDQRSPPALWARQSAADSLLAQGISQLVEDRALANQALEAARDAYRTVAENAKPNSMVWQRAQFGLAQAHEALAEPDDAIQAYEQLIARAGEDPIAAEARRRMVRVERLKAQEFYTWFAQAEPPAPGSSGSPLGNFGEGMPGGSPFGPGGAGAGAGAGADLPFDLTTIPESPDLSIPGTIDQAPLPSTGPIDIPVRGEDAPPAPELTPPNDPTPPADDSKPPADDSKPPADDSKPPADDSTPPADDTTPPADDAPADAAAEVPEVQE